MIPIYARPQALAADLLVDVTRAVKEVGFQILVAITAALQARLVPNKAEQADGQQYAGRLWDVLWNAFVASRKTQANHLSFEVVLIEVINRQRLHRILKLEAVLSLDDPAELESFEEWASISLTRPVLTIGFPKELA